MSLGALIGYAYAKNKSWVKFFSRDLAFISIGLLAFTLWGLKFEMQFFTDEFYAILFGMVILGMIDNERINIDTKLSRFLGKISYGIYMYHWLIIFLVLKHFPVNENIFYYNVMLYSLVLCLTVFIAWISYSFVEKRFLQLKPNQSKTVYDAV